MAVVNQTLPRRGRMTPRVARMIKMYKRLCLASSHKNWKQMRRLQAALVFHLDAINEPAEAAAYYQAIIVYRAELWNAENLSEWATIE